jgi:hypothetical protein
MNTLSNKLKGGTQGLDLKFLLADIGAGGAAASLILVCENLKYKPSTAVAEGNTCHN